MRIFAKFGLCLAIASISTISSADIIFNGVTIPGGENGDIETITVDPISGDILINVGNGWVVSQDTGEPPPPPPPPPPPLPEGQLAVSLAADATVVNQWEEVTFTWQSAEAVRCVARKGTPEWLGVTIDPLAAGSVTLQMTEFGTDVPFRLFCFDDANMQVAAQVLLTINEAPEPQPEVAPEPEVAACSEPSEVTFGTVEKWTDRVGGMNADFPNVLQSSFDVFTRRNDYYALEFQTTEEVLDGSVTTVSLSSGVRHVSISECPGNFLVDTPATCEQRQGIGESLVFSTDPAATSGCVLDMNKRYYLNVTYADVDNRIPTDTSSCGASTCATRIGIGIAVQ